MSAIAASRFSHIPKVRWGEADPLKRGPLICMDRKGAPRNCIGNYGGQYGLYRAIAASTGAIDQNFIPDFTNTVSPLRFSPNAHWSGDNAVTSFDPFGHLVPELFGDLIGQGYNIRPTIVFTPAKLDIPEIHSAIGNGLLVPDGKVLEYNGQINVTKIVIEPAWYLPGMAKQLGVDHQAFRESLYYGMGGGPEALLDSTFDVYLPPFGEISVYVIGDLAKVGDPNVEQATRIHDKCSSSDIHGSDMCICRPGLIWGYEEGVRVAQNGGATTLVYTEAEGRGHGVAIKNGVYNARMAGEDRAEDYLPATERVAGAADLRTHIFTADVYRWMSITKIDVLMSGNPEKIQALKDAGIEIVHAPRPVPPERLKPGTGVTEYAAKRRNGYYYSERLVCDGPTS